MNVPLFQYNFSRTKTKVFTALLEPWKHQTLVSLGKESRGFPGGLVVKNPPDNAGDSSSISGSGKCPGEGNGDLLQYSCLGNPMDRGAQWATDHRVTKMLDTT